MNHQHRRTLIALLSALISQLLLIPLLLPPPNPFPIPNSTPYLQNSQIALLSLLSSSSAALSFLSFHRKRKRPRFPEGPVNDSDKRSRLDREAAIGPASNPDSFKQFFRMKSSTFEWLCGLLEPLLECRDPVESPLGLPAEVRLGIGLYRLATGADYPDVSRRFGVPEPVSKFCVKQLCRVLCTNYRFWIGFPSQSELAVSVSDRIETLSGLPNCCGIIGCARFTFDRGSPSADRRRSIVAQIVVDSSSKILNIAAGFHGSKRDSQVLKSSSLFSDISKGVLLNSPPVTINGIAIPQYLTGISDYPLLPWLMVPFSDTQPGTAEENFNAAVRRLARLSWAKSVASLKNWGALNGCVEVEYKGAVACIGACSILHNMLIMREDETAICHDFVDGLVLGDQAVVGLSGNSDDEGLLTMRRVLAARAQR